MTIGIAPPGNRFASVARGGPDVGAAVGGTLGRLLRPAEAGEDDRVWTVDPQAVEATPAGIARVLVHAGRRELSAAAVRLWPPSSHPYSQVRRWPAPGRHAGLVGAAVHAVAGGIIVQFGARSSVPSLLDVVVEDSGTQGARLRLRPTREGGVVAPVATADGPAMLRVGIVGAASDPVRAFRALEVVRGRVADLAPRPIGMGQRGQLRWTLEQRLTGRVARRLDADQLARLAAAWTDLPAAPGPAKAVVTDLLRIALLVPRHTSHVRHVLAHLGPPRCRGWPATETSGTATCWSTAAAWWASSTGVRGTRPASREPTCSTCSPWPTGAGASPWARSGCAGRGRGPTSSAWSVRPCATLTSTLAPEVLEQLGIAWWASAVAGTLERLPQRAYDEDWIGANVTSVLRTRWA